MKIVGLDHVLQEFPKSYYKNKNDKRKVFDNNDKKQIHDPNIAANTKAAIDLDLHKANALRNSFILEEDEEIVEKESLEKINESQKLHLTSENNEKTISLPFSELSFIDLSNNLVI